MNLFLNGLLIGFVIALPPGPLTVLCIGKTLQRGYLEGAVVALSIALVDGLYAFLATLGLYSLHPIIHQQEPYLYLTGGTLLLLLGIKTFFEKIPFAAPHHRGTGILMTFFKTIILATSSPITLFAFMGAFSTIGHLGELATTKDILTLCSGVFCGSSSWFLLLTTIAATVRSFITPVTLRYTSFFTGFFLSVCGVSSLTYGIFLLNH